MKGVNFIMKKQIRCVGVILVCALLLSGCGNEIPDMSEEEKSMVVNYAADIVQKYDKNHPVKLQTITIQEEEMETAAAEEADTAKTDIPEMDTTEPDTENSDVQETAEEIAAEVSPEMTLDNFFQTEAFHFSYEDYEIDDSYPQSGTEAYFAMNATAGNKLLVLKFQVENQTQTDAELDVLHMGIRFRVQVNGETKNALTTMLLNDFANYQDVIAAGESRELVVVCEIPQEQETSVETISLVLRNADGTETISLR